MTAERELSLLLRHAAREHLGLSDGDYWPSDVADAQARAVLAARSAPAERQEWEADVLRPLVTNGPPDERWAEWFPDVMAMVCAAMLHQREVPAPAERAGGEAYTVAQIREAFAKHASPDDWGVPAFYVETMIAALRGEYDRDDHSRAAALSEQPEDGAR